MNSTQPAYTTLTAACGHPSTVRLSLDAERAAIEILQVSTNDCIPCVKGSRRTTRNILWADVNRRQS